MKLDYITVFYIKITLDKLVNPFLTSSNPDPNKTE